MDRASSRRTTGPPIARVGRWLCLGGAALGLLGLSGWVSGRTFLTTILPGLPPMMPNAALSLLLIGVAGAARRDVDARPALKTLSVLGAGLVLVVGIGTLAQYALHVDLRIDRLLPTGQTTLAPGPPSPMTALALTLLALAILFFDVRPAARARPSEWFILGAGLTAFTGLTGIVLDAAPLYRLTRLPLIGVSLPTALSLLTTSMGLLLERPAAGGMRVATSPGPGGAQFRRLVLPALAFPLLLGLAVAELSVARGIVDLATPIAILSATITVVGLLVLLAMATPLNLAHEQVESSGRQIRHLVEEAPDGIFVADLEGRYIDVNDAGCRILGCSREDIIGKTIADLLSPDDIARLWQSRGRLTAWGSVVAEWSLRRKDGSFAPVEVSARILPDGRWQGLVRDISERKRLEHDLRVSEARSTGILSISADAIISIDEDQRITLFNEGAERMFGYSKTEVMGAPVDSLLPTRLRAAHRRHVAGFSTGSEVARKMGAGNAVIVGRRRNGEEFPADAAISRLQVDGSTVLTVVLRDVTEQKRIEDEQRFLAQAGPALATSLDYEETLSRIAELAVHGLSDVCMIDILDDAGEVGRVRVVGRDPSMASICAALSHAPPDRERPNLVRATLTSRQPTVVQHPSPDDVAWIPASDGHPLALQALELHSAILVPLAAHARLFGVLSLLSTASSRLFGPQDLRVAGEFAERAAMAIDSARLYRAARRATQVRDEVLGIVAHDLRSPLSVIQLEAGMLRTGRGRTARTPEQSGEGITRAAARMNRLIQDLLDVTRMEAGRLTITQSRIPVAQVASDAVAIHQALAARASLELGLELPEAPLDLWADRDRLLQVFDNLVGNAIRVSPAGGRITIGAAPQGADLLFWVRDTGPGIAAEDQPHLFDRFWQGRTASTGGAGLGLPIVKGIVDAHGGRVWVESAPGQGSTFFFTMPMAPSTGVEPLEPASEAVTDDVAPRQE